MTVLSGNGDAGVLIIDDNEIFLRTLERSLARRNLKVGTAASGKEAMQCLREDDYDRAVLDLNLGKESGLHLIPCLLDRKPSMRILVLTGYASIATAVAAIRLGAASYLSKPADVDDILASFGQDANAAGESMPVKPAPLSVRQLEWEHLNRVLLENDGNITATARALGLHRRSLQRKLRKHTPR